MSAVPSGWKPERGIEIIATTPPGGGTDRSARALLKAIELNKLVEVPTVVTNIPGDGGRKAWSHMNGRAGDNNVIAINSPSNVTDVLTGGLKPGQNRATPIAILYTEYIAFITKADSRFKTGADFMKALSEKPKETTISLSTSLGNPNHIAVAKVLKHCGAPVTAPKIRVFDSARDVVTDIIAGNADVGAITAASAVPELEAGKVRAIATSSPERLGGAYATVPTWKEQSVDCVVGAWRGAAGPDEIDPAAVKYWEGVLSAAVKTKEWHAERDRYLWTEMYLDGPALKSYLDQEYAELKAILGDLGLLAA